MVQINPNNTFLELGSLFDPLLINKSYGYHFGNHNYCAECYPSNEPIISYWKRYGLFKWQFYI